MLVKKTLFALLAIIAVAVSALTARVVAASAATPACGGGCISVFSRELGTSSTPNFVEAILGGRAQVGAHVGLKRASASDPSEDILPRAGSVATFYAAGIVSAAVNEHYGPLLAVQQEYAPFGVRTGLCVGLKRRAYQTEGLTLQSCSAGATTVWIVDPDLSRSTPGYFPICLLYTSPSPRD